MRLTLASKNHVADNVWTFQFEPEQSLAWQAGQFLRVGLDHPDPDEEGTSRQFTIAAPPHEGRPAITTRLTNSSFKRALAALPIGDHIQLLDLPAGDFIWRASAQPLIFAAQGIGITPFYAIITDRHHRGLPVNATLLHSHQPGTAAVFGPALRAIVDSDPTFDIREHVGTLTPDILAHTLPDYARRLVYVSGPKSFVRLCTPPYDLPLASLKQDQFPGYATPDY